MDNVLAKLITIEIGLLKKFNEILSYFYESTVELSYNKKPTIQKVILFKCFLKRICEIDEDDEVDIEKFKKSLLENLNVCMKISNIHKIVLLLDPTRRSMKMIECEDEKKRI